MADFEIGNNNGVQNVNGSNRSGAQDLDNTDTIAAMKTRLIALGYTAKTLNTMTYNDLVYAIRLADAPTSIR